MKELVTLSMIFTVMLGYVGVLRLCWDSKWFIIVVFLYSLGALAILGMVTVIHTKDFKPRNARPELQLRPNENEWIVKRENTPSFSKYV